jgi:CRISPR type III-A-associated protein Csm2
MAYQNQSQNRELLEEKFLNEMVNELGEAYPTILEEGRNELLFADKVKGLLASLMNIGQEREKRENISSSQLRNIFSRVKRVEKISELYSLRPKLAYVYGRPNTKDEMKKLIVLLDDQIKKVKNEKQLEKFKSFFEAIIAYHKFYGGSN